MKFSITNINTLLIILATLIGSSVVSYISIFEGLLVSDLILIAKVFLLLIILINVFLIVFIIYKFRLIIITIHEIYIIYPFRFFIITSKLEKIRNIKWSSFIDQKGIYYRQITFKTGNDKSISLSDKEFENLDSLVNAITSKMMENKKIDKLNVDRAKSNKSMQLFNLLFSIFLFCSTIYIFVKMINWNSTKLIIVGFASILTGNTIYFNLKKYLTYRRIHD